LNYDFYGVYKILINNATCSLDFTSGNPVYDTWIQGKLDNTTGTAIWKYSDGTEIEYFNWATNEPLGYPHFIYIVSSRTVWYDAFWYYNYSVLCQIKH